MKNSLIMVIELIPVEFRDLFFLLILGAFEMPFPWQSCFPSPLYLQFLFSHTNYQTSGLVMYARCSVLLHLNKVSLLLIFYGLQTSLNHIFKKAPCFTLQWKWEIWRSRFPSFVGQMHIAVCSCGNNVPLSLCELDVVFLRCPGHKLHASKLVIVSYSFSNCIDTSFFCRCR